MLIKVKTLTGKEIEIDIEPTDKVERIKERVEEKEGIPPQQQRLIYSGKQMNDEKTAADYKIQGGSVLHLVLALRGGSTPHRPCIHLTASSWVTAGGGGRRGTAGPVPMLLGVFHRLCYRTEMWDPLPLSQIRPKLYPSSPHPAPSPLWKKKRTFWFLC